ncbi:MAG TPA: hypothetical protein VHA52_09910 [Candidatus Babeliaceae bacterium]|nr:hypothetical protein [Candidatus Babeliaceae bacterium]
MYSNNSAPNPQVFPSLSAPPSIEEEITALKKLISERGVEKVAQQYPDYIQLIYDVNSLLADPSLLVGSSGGTGKKDVLFGSGRTDNFPQALRYSGKRGTYRFPFDESIELSNFPLKSFNESMGWCYQPQGYKPHLSKYSGVDVLFSKCNPNKWGL